MPPDPSPLSPGQLAALLAVAGRELTWTVHRVGREVRGWRRLARAIPDRTLRHDALLTLAAGRLNAEGAALFGALSRRRDPSLLRLLVAYQLIFDLRDTLNERPCDDPLVNGPQLHRALLEALDPGGPTSDYYRHHRWRDDGGYLDALVAACRRGCAALPSYERVRPLVVRAAERAGVQTFNHDPVPARRDAALAAWAAREHPGETRASWFELAAAASSTLALHAFLTLAAEPDVDDAAIAAVDDAYSLWICAASTLLDSFVDQGDDAAQETHSYVAHYPDAATAAARIAELVRESALRARALPNGRRHALIAMGMVAMYLSKDGARTAALRPLSREILTAGGSLPRVQLPIMRAVRIVRSLQDA